MNWSSNCAHHLCKDPPWQDFENVAQRFPFHILSYWPFKKASFFSFFGFFNWDNKLLLILILWKACLHPKERKGWWAPKWAFCMIVSFHSCVFWTALPVFCYRIVLQEPIISAKIPQVGVPVWPANQSDCGLQWKKLNYTNHSSSTLEMGTEAFLNNQDLWACDLSPATLAVQIVEFHTWWYFLPNSVPLSRCHIPTPGLFCALSHHYHFFQFASHIDPWWSWSLPFLLEDLSWWGHFLTMKHRNEKK